MKYNVYTKVHYGAFGDIDIVVTGIEANSLMAAEHVLLDNYHVDNAHADSMIQPTNTFLSAYMDKSYVMSCQEFRVRMDAEKASGQDQLNEALSEVAEIQSRIDELCRKIKELENQKSEANAEAKRITETYGISRHITPQEKIDAAFAANFALGKLLTN